MYKIISSIIAAFALTSCMSSYNIQGNANTNEADGSMLYLKVFSPKDFNMANLDSCEIVHGQFHFDGTVDSVRMASVCTDRNELFPVVVESGDVEISDSNTGITFGGTPLNDKLYTFYKVYVDIMSELQDVDRRPYQAVLNGEEMDVAAYNEDMSRLNARLDSLVTNCIQENFDNPLGPGIFFYATKNLDYPVLEPWIEEIWAKATESFKNDSYVKEYFDKAKEIQQYQTGMKEMPGTTTPAPAQQNAAPAPTPNQLAGTASDSTKVK